MLVSGELHYTKSSRIYVL